MFIVAVGNAFDGIVFYGPFEAADDAVVWAANNHMESEWNVVEVTSI